MKPKRKSLVSIRLARKLLEEEGFTIIEESKPIIIDGVRISDVDLLARGPEGKLYAIEVKAGKIDVNGVRQAYTNALLLNAKPLIIGRGFADDSARMMAERLGVEYRLLEDLFLVDINELELAIREALISIGSTIASSILSLLRIRNLSEKDYEVLESIALSHNFVEASKRLNVSIHDLATKVKSLVKQGLLPETRDYELLKLAAITVLCFRQLCMTKERH
ncbi:MAG: recombinase RecB [Pyrodictiaceae archaeon]